MILMLSLLWNSMVADFPQHPWPEPYLHTLAHHEEAKAQVHWQRASIDAFIDVWGTDFKAISSMQAAVQRLLDEALSGSASVESFRAAQEAVAHARFRLEAMHEEQLPSDLYGLRNAWLAPVRRAEEVVDRCREVAASRQRQQRAQAEGLSQEERDLLHWFEKLQEQVADLLDHQHTPRLARRALASLHAFAEAHPRTAVDLGPVAALDQRMEVALAEAEAEAQWRSETAWAEAEAWSGEEGAREATDVCIPWSMQLLDARPDVAHEESFLAFKKRCCVPGGDATGLHLGAYPWPLTLLPYLVTEIEPDPDPHNVLWSGPDGSSYNESFTQAEVDAFNEDHYRAAFEAEGQRRPGRPPRPKDPNQARLRARAEAQQREERRCRAIDQASKSAYDQAVRAWRAQGNVCRREDEAQRKGGIEAVKRLRRETARALSKADRKAYERANRQLDDTWKHQKNTIERTLRRLEQETQQDLQDLHRRHNEVRKGEPALLAKAHTYQESLNTLHDRAAHAADEQRGQEAHQVRRTSLAATPREPPLMLASRPTELAGFAPIQTPLGQPFVTSAGTTAWSDLVATTDQYAQAQARIEHLSQRPLRQDMVDVSALMIHRADAQFGENDALSGQEMLSQARLLLDVAVDIGLAVTLPQVAITKSVVQMATGRNLITGQPLSDWDQGWEAVNVLCLGHAQHIAQTSRWLMRWAQSEGASSRAAARMLGHWRAADQAARLERVSRVKPELFGQATYQGVVDGTYIGAAYSSAIVQTVGELSATERAIAREFGGIQGVLAWRDPRVQQIASRWGTSWDGHNQLAVHLFRSHDASIKDRLSRLASTEISANLTEGSLSRVLEESDSLDIIDTYSTFDDVAETIKINAQPENHHINSKKNKEIWWIEHATDKTSKGRGLAVLAYDGKNQTVLTYTSKDWKKNVRRFHEE